MYICKSRLTAHGRSTQYYVSNYNVLAPCERKLLEDI